MTLLLMYLAHIIADFNLQGCLANFKQKEWWKKNYPDKEYEGDWVTALIIHSLCWGIIVFLPIFYNLAWQPTALVYVLLGFNVAIHAIIDHLKANRKVFNLTQDQCLHMVQITTTWFVCYMVYGVI